MDKRLLMLSAATVTFALGIGFYMQHTAPSRGLDLHQQPADTQDVPQEPETGTFKIEKITLTSVPPKQTQPEPGVQPVAAERKCSMTTTAMAQPGAMVDLSVAAPCDAGGRITVHHHGMMFTATLDDSGEFRQKIPALSETAVFIVEPQDGLAEVAAVSVPDIGKVDRVVLQWSGNSGFEIHARENGAQYGGPGHVWHGSNAGVGQGQVLRLGDAGQLAPRMAEVYSIPHIQNMGGSVDLSVETEINEINCGRDIEAQVLTLTPASETQRVRTRDLTLAIPDCTAKGDFLVLNNLLENLKIAAN